jgi:V/A-type H+-transporting ATPase subunit E
MAEHGAHQGAAKGLETLIARLREDGVTAGRAEADRIMAEAQAQARAIVEKAEAEAAAKRETTQREVEAMRRGGEEALRAAVRDSILELKDLLTRRFAADVEKTIAGAMRETELLEKMILAVVGRARAVAGVDKAAEIEMVLPRSLVGLDDLRRKPEELKVGSLSHFAAAEAAEMLREGVTFSRAEDEADGIRVILVDRGVTVDLTDRAVAEEILAHLQPRFRALMEGVVS